MDLKVLVCRASKLKHQKTPKGRETHNKAQRKYTKTKRGKATQRRARGSRRKYLHSEKGLAAIQKYQKGPKFKAAQKRYREKKRLEREDQDG